MFQLMLLVKEVQVTRERFLLPCWCSGIIPPESAYVKSTFVKMRACLRLHDACVLLETRVGPRD